MSDQFKAGPCGCQGRAGRPTHDASRRAQLGVHNTGEGSPIFSSNSIEIAVPNRGSMTRSRRRHRHIQRPTAEATVGVDRCSLYARCGGRPWSNGPPNGIHEAPIRSGGQASTGDIHVTRRGPCVNGMDGQRFTPFLQDDCRTKDHHDDDDPCQSLHHSVPRFPTIRRKSGTSYIAGLPRCQCDGSVGVASAHCPLPPATSTFSPTCHKMAS